MSEKGGERERERERENGVILEIKEGKEMRSKCFKSKKNEIDR